MSFFRISGYLPITRRASRGLLALSGCFICIGGKTLWQSTLRSQVDIFEGDFSGRAGRCLGPVNTNWIDVVESKNSPIKARGV